MVVNTALADVLDRGAAATEPDEVLAALVDHGLYIPVTDAGSVFFLRDADGEPVLPGYISEQCCADRLPQAAGAVHCDVLRLLDIAEQTGVKVLLPHSTAAWARVPMPLIARTLAQRGRQAAGEVLKLTWSTHPLALSLRRAVMERIRDHPAVRTVWVAHARWLETGVEHLMLYISVDEELPSPSAKRLMQTLMSEDVHHPSPDDPKVGMIELNVTAHAATIAELATMGLDTVRVQQDSGRVEVISREFDAPPA